MVASISLLILQSICAGLSLIITLLSFIKFIQKKNPIARVLFQAFLSFTMALFFQVSNAAGWFLETHNFIILKLFDELVSAYVFLSIGLFFLLHFAYMIFSKEEKSIIPIAIWLIILDVWMLIKLFTEFVPKNMIINLIIGPDVQTILFASLIVPAIVINGLKLLKKVKDEPEYTKVLYITLMGFALILTILFFIIETIIGEITGEYENLFSYIAWPFAIVSLIFAYLGLYKK